MLVIDTYSTSKTGYVYSIEALVHSGTHVSPHLAPLHCVRAPVGQFAALPTLSGLSQQNG